MFSKSLIFFLYVIILKFLNIESFSRLKDTKFSFVTDLPRTDEIYSLFLKSKRIAGTISVKIRRLPLEIRLDILKMVIKIKKVLVHNR
tara:strand:+ start:300 stop:563 length:264 start_codon:yes stop_codon:yes gene_type:complete